MMKDASVERIHTDTAVTLLVPHKSIAAPPTTINCCLEFHFPGYRFLNYAYEKYRSLIDKIKSALLSIDKQSCLSTYLYTRSPLNF